MSRTSWSPRAVSKTRSAATTTSKTPGDDTWTSAAEVYAILADSARVITALEKAAQRKEPTASYVLANPLFRYLSSDARFQKLQQTLMEQRQEMRAAVSQIAL